MKELVLFFALALALTGCSSSAPTKTVDQAMAETRRVMAENSLIGAVTRDCLREPLSTTQVDYLLHKTEFEIQKYVFALAYSQCQDRELRHCERQYPGQCLATPGEVDGRQP